MYFEMYLVKLHVFCSFLPLLPVFCSLFCFPTKSVISPLVQQELQIFCENQTRRVLLHISVWSVCTKPPARFDHCLLR